MNTAATILVSIIGALATAYFTSRFYTLRTKAELQKEIETRFNKQKWETYTEFIDLVFQVFESRRTGYAYDKHISYKLNRLTSHLLIIGTDEVVKAVNEWLTYSHQLKKDETLNTHEARPKLAKAIIEMRKDLGYESSKINLDDLTTLLFKGAIIREYPFEPFTDDASL